MIIDDASYSGMFIRILIDDVLWETSAKHVDFYICLAYAVDCNVLFEEPTEKIKIHVLPFVQIARSSLCQDELELIRSPFVFEHKIATQSGSFPQVTSLDYFSKKWKVGVIITWILSVLKILL